MKTTCLILVLICVVLTNYNGIMESDPYHKNATKLSNCEREGI